MWLPGDTSFFSVLEVENHFAAKGRMEILMVLRAYFAQGWVDKGLCLKEGSSSRGIAFIRWTCLCQRRTNPH